jgi:methionine-rich copper-binding protein CopC
MAKNLATTALAVMAACAIASAADARPRMVNATPAANAVVKAAPKEIRILFSEQFALPLTGVAIASDSGQPLDTGKAGTNNNNVRQLVVPITGAVMPGKYLVLWHVVGADNVRVAGQFNFEYKP